MPLFQEAIRSLELHLCETEEEREAVKAKHRQEDADAKRLVVFMIKWIVFILIAYAIAAVIYFSLDLQSPQP